ncbi:MAG: hypothetical protein M3M96_08765 [Candidatus Eremiobacteraeota bacterium]|nr:hypothetical protein [Candidatus Eremiobacteraeota bacterium]
MRIVGLFALLLIALPCAAPADEYGPHPAIRAIRGALPILLARHLKRLDTPGRLTIPDIVVDGDVAIATWKYGSGRGLVLLNYHPNGWWMTGSSDLPSHLLDLATAHIPKFARADALAQTVGYRSTWQHVSGAPLTGFTFHDRAPTASEMAPSRGADAVYFFTLQPNGTQKISVAAGSTLDVWAPFVLDPHLRYTLTLAMGDPTIGPLEGRLSDNTMHFILPAFTAPPSVELMGEIDADP